LTSHLTAFAKQPPGRPGGRSAGEADALGVSRKTLSSILNGRAGISAEMAIRLSLAFETSAESWLNQQTQYDLWQADRHRKSLHVKKLVAA
jgi:antitoxin HigA-1